MIGVLVHRLKQRALLAREARDGTVADCHLAISALMKQARLAAVGMRLRAATALHFLLGELYGHGHFGGSQGRVAVNQLHLFRFL